MQVTITEEAFAGRGLRTYTSNRTPRPGFFSQQLSVTVALTALALTFTEADQKVVLRRERAEELAEALTWILRGAHVIVGLSRVVGEDTTCLRRLDSIRLVAEHGSCDLPLDVLPLIIDDLEALGRGEVRWPGMDRGARTTQPLSIRDHLFHSRAR